MKVDIWITTDDGGEFHAEDMSWSEACAAICNQHILQELCKTLSSDIVKDFIHDEVVANIEKEKNNESNEN